MIGNSTIIDSLKIQVARARENEWMAGREPMNRVLSGNLKK